ncbi:MAG: hypothetical protein Q4B30_06975 [Coriobacteriaceae bacterium]|nr:hypothetical protein [Coriobacteriaceae bacterium]
MTISDEMGGGVQKSMERMAARMLGQLLRELFMNTKRRVHTALECHKYGMLMGEPMRSVKLSPASLVRDAAAYFADNKALAFDANTLFIPAALVPQLKRWKQENYPGARLDILKPLRGEMREAGVDVDDLDDGALLEEAERLCDGKNGPAPNISPTAAEWLAQNDPDGKNFDAVDLSDALGDIDPAKRESYTRCMAASMRSRGLSVEAVGTTLVFPRSERDRVRDLAWGAAVHGVSRDDESARDLVDNLKGLDGAGLFAPRLPAAGETSGIGGALALTGARPLALPPSPLFEASAYRNVHVDLSRDLVSIERGATARFVAGEHGDGDVEHAGDEAAAPVPAEVVEDEAILAPETDAPHQGAREDAAARQTHGRNPFVQDLNGDNIPDRDQDRDGDGYSDLVDQVNGRQDQDVQEAQEAARGGDVLDMTNDEFRAYAATGKPERTGSAPDVPEVSLENKGAR